MKLRRDGGAIRPPYGQGHTAIGDLYLSHSTADGRRVAVLQFQGADREWPLLFDPRLIGLSADEFQIMEFERFEGAWVMQHWGCELL